MTSATCVTAKQVSAALSIGATAVSTLFGGWDESKTLLAMLVVFDYFTGVTAAVFTGTLSSKIGYLGIIKKCCIFLCVALACRISAITGVPVRELTVFFYISNESISLLENLGRVIPLPDKLISVLQALGEGEQTNKEE